MKRRWRKHRNHDPAELNITAFMNLMVILVPFLLMTAVFSRLAVLELNLPAAQSEASEPLEPTFALEITVREDAIEVGERTGGLIRRVAHADGGYDLTQLAEALYEVKRVNPDVVDATVLLEPDISYQVLIEVMDTVRVRQQHDPAVDRIVTAELFPDIAIGDAPVRN